MRKRDWIIRFWLMFVLLASILSRWMDYGGLNMFNDPFNFLMSILSVLVPWYFILKLTFWIYDRFMKRPKYMITCPACHTSGQIYIKNGASKGTFLVIGKTENGGLKIKKCPNCKNKLELDTMSWKVTIR